MWKTMRMLTIGAGVLLLGACGGEGAGGQGGAVTSTVTMRDNAFVPSDPVIAPGEIELVNQGESPHTFTIEGEGIDVEVDAGQTTTETVDLAPGSYALFCAFHRAQGMEATLTVEG